LLGILKIFENKKDDRQNGYRPTTSAEFPAGWRLNRSVASGIFQKWHPFASGFYDYRLASYISSFSPPAFIDYLQLLYN